MNILLEQEQIDLLITLVEASRNVSRNQRQKFFASPTFGNPLSEIIHAGFSGGGLEAYKGDIEILAQNGLLNLGHSSNSSVYFDVTPLGYRYYQDIKQHTGEPARNVETAVKDYLSGNDFQKKYPEAYQKWTQAETLLWSSDSQQQLTTVGHLCREAMSAFASALVNQYSLSAVEEDPAKTVARVKAVIEHRANLLGSTVKPFLEALIAYWGTLSDLVQRQEHGAQKEGESLVWEDGRRVVFQTMVLMVELDRALR